MSCRSDLCASPERSPATAVADGSAGLREDDEVVAVDDLVGGAVGEVGGAAAGIAGERRPTTTCARGPWRTPCRRGRRSRRRRRRRTGPSPPTTPAGSSDTARSTSARRAPSSTTTVPAARRRRRSRACGPTGARAGAAPPCRRRAYPATASASTSGRLRRGDDGPHARPGGDLGRRHLRGHAPAPPHRARRRRPAPRAGLVDLDDLLDERRRRVEAGVGREQAGRVGEQHEQVGVDEVGDEGGEAVVVAEADLVVGDGVVLVDHRDDAELEQPLQRAAGVEVLRPDDEVERAPAAPARPPARGGERRGRRRAMSRLWPTAETACRVRASRGRRSPPSPRAGRPAAMAPDVTATTWWPSARSPASSAHERLDGATRRSALVVGDRRRADLGDDDHQSPPSPRIESMPPSTSESHSSSGRYSNSRRPTRTTSPALAPAWARAWSTPRLLEPRLGVLERLELGEVGEGDGPLGGPAHDPPGAVVVALDDARPRRAPGGARRSRSGSGSAARAARTASAMAPVSRADALAGDGGEAHLGIVGASRLGRQVGAGAGDDPRPLEQLGLGRRPARRAGSAPARPAAAARRSPTPGRSARRGPGPARRGAGTGGPRPRPSLAPSMRPGMSATTNSASSRRTTPEVGLEGGEGVVGDLGLGRRDPPR